MEEFSFGQDLSPDQNIELFFILLELVDKEMTVILKENINKVFPLPSDPQDRTRVRISFNKEIMKRLGKL